MVVDVIPIYLLQNGKTERIDILQYYHYHTKYLLQNGKTEKDWYSEILSLRYQFIYCRMARLKGLAF